MSAGRARSGRRTTALAWLGLGLALVMTAPHRAGAAPDEPDQAGEADQAGEPGQARARLMQARAALEQGAYQRAVELVAPLIGAGPGARPGDLAGPAPGHAELDRADRAEAWRIHGLALFFLGRYDGAEVSFFEYLKLDVDGRLDPALVPPEAIVFFEDVRARNAAELRKYRPPPKKKRSWALNLLPPAGQFQNGHRVKGWLIAGAGTALLATHLTSFAILRRWCDPDTGTCTSGGEPRTEQARTMRTVNLASGVLFFAVLGYGIVDGWVHYQSHDDSLSIGVVPGLDGAGVFVHGRY